MILKELQDISATDIVDLIKIKRKEDQEIEYKQKLPNESEIKEFLKDVSSFANASGGDIIFGIAEEKDENNQNTGMPKEIIGLPGINIDQEKLRLLNIISSNISPRITAQIQPVEDFAEGPLLILRIRKSWRPPHMIYPNKDPKFYTRDNNGKRPLDIEQIRSAFLLSETIEEKILNTRNYRLSKVVSGDTPVLVDKDAKVIIHLMPFESFYRRSQIDLSAVKSLGSDFIQPVRASGYDARFNFEGFVTYLGYDCNNPSVNQTYLQFMRNGIIESVESRSLAFNKPHISILALQDTIIKAVARFVEIEKKLDVPPPFIIFISFLGVKGYTLEVPNAFPDMMNEIVNNDLLLPDILIEDYNDSIKEKMRPSFDAIWQAGGWDRSYSWDATRQTITRW
jgi:hypothetical protein